VLSLNSPLRSSGQYFPLVSKFSIIIIIPSFSSSVKLFALAARLQFQILHYTDNSFLFPESRIKFAVPVPAICDFKVTQNS
jgi:hypothetical protein